MVIGKSIFPWGKKAGFLSILLLMGMTFGLGDPEATAKESEILLLHSNNVTGYLFPCPT